MIGMFELTFFLELAMLLLVIVITRFVDVILNSFVYPIRKYMLYLLSLSLYRTAGVA